MAKRMAEQMELFEPVTRGFEEGGLMDEGGTVDPVSGNEVPPGSTQEEVRDDIPAQLSEGEFVFPADVVRYFGLEKLMEMRQEAKMGLKRMEAMGQMGNSEEATMPDDLPFSIEDLDMEDEEEYNNTQEFARGGVVYAQQGTFVNPDPQSGVYYQPPAPTTTGVAEAPMVAASAPANPMGGYKPPQQAFTPVRLPQQLTPTFQGTVGFGPEGVEYETVTYVNEAGQTLVLKKNKQTGQLVDLAGNPASIPEGYKLKGEEEEEEVAPVTTQTTQVTKQDDGGREDDEGITSGASVVLGGQSGTGSQKGLRVGNFGVFGVSYDVPGTSMLGGITGIASNLAGLAKNGLPNGATATFFNKTDPSISVVVNAQDFNAMKNSSYKGELAENYKQALDSLTAIKQGKFEESNYDNLTGLSKDLVQRASVKGLMDKVDIENPQGVVDSLKNFGTGTFSEAVDKLNPAERAVLDDMGVDLDLSTMFDEPDFEATPSAIAEVAARQKSGQSSGNWNTKARQSSTVSKSSNQKKGGGEGRDNDDGGGMGHGGGGFSDRGGFSGLEGD